MVLDYSQAINTFTQLAAYPLPRIDDFINITLQYKTFRTIDLKSTYHQVPIHKDKIAYCFRR